MTEGTEIAEESSADIFTHPDAVTTGRRVRAVVTGSRGFIGSHICDAFLALGCDVIGVDNGSSGVDNTPAGVNRIDEDVMALTRGDLVGADIVVHAAAYADVRGNWDEADGYTNRVRLLEQNVLATAHVLECAPADATFVLTSTAAVYGSQPGRSWPHAEQHFQMDDVLSPYAASKIAAEALVASYSRKAKRRWYAMRLVNVVGARTHHGVVSDFVRMAQATGRINAIDNGRQRKSWVHVLDVARAITTLAGSITAPSGVYNVASRDRISWWDVVEEMGLTTRDVTFVDREAGHIGDPVDLTVSAGKLATYHACERPVRAGIREALDSLGWRSP